MLDSGIYIVTLTNENPISVNAYDPRIAEGCIKVTAANCKIGRAKHFRIRERNYWRTFGKEHVRFLPIAVIAEPELAERVILAALRECRIRSGFGRRTEWLEGITAEDAVVVAIKAMHAAQIHFSTRPIEQWLSR